VLKSVCTCVDNYSLYVTIDNIVLNITEREGVWEEK